MNWEKAREAAYVALRRSLVLVDPAFQKGADEDIERWAGKAVNYWRARQEGALLSDHLLSTTGYEMQMLCEKVGVSGAAKQRRCGEIFKMFALIGAELVEAFEDPSPPETS